MIVEALCAAAAVLLIVAGPAKLRTPAPAASMIVTFWPGLSRRRSRQLARFVGLVELASGLAVLVDGGRIALAALGGCYLVVSVVALRLATGGRSAPCGCFGAADGVVGPAHVILDLAALAAVAWAVVRPPGAIATLFGHGPLTGLTLCAEAVLLAALGYLSITALPALAAARRTLEGSA